MADQKLKLGEEIQHFTHPEHPLHLVFLPYIYTCNGCKEYGAGARFRCQQCNSADIHDFCAKAPASVNHPYHTQHPLIFHTKPAGGLIKSAKCEMCGKTTRGFSLRCPSCYFCLHPCCSKLPQELKFSGHPEHPLRLLAGSPLPESSPYTCNSCGKEGTTWVYNCAACDFYVHVLCAKGVINGLQAQGIKVPEKLSKFQRAARFATQVAQIFVDGLVEGLGEELGDVIIDTFTRDVKL